MPGGHVREVRLTVPHTPQALTLTRISLDLREGNGRSTIAYFSGAEYSKAFMVLGSDMVTVNVDNGVVSR